MLFYFILLITKIIKGCFKVLSFFWKQLLNIELFIETFWLSVFSTIKLSTYITKYYSRNKRYISDKMTQSGPFDWENKILKKYPVDKKDVVIIGSGGGREAYFLQNHGAFVKAFEADINMVNYATNFFKSNGLKNVISDYLPINTIPNSNCDIFWMGWGVYTHIITRSERIKLLLQIRQNLNQDGYLLISFWRNFKSKDRDQKMTKYNKLFKRFGGRTVERGEYFCNGLWAKYYTKTEIIEEANLAGFKVDYYCDTEYGCAVLTC